MAIHTGWKLQLGYVGSRTEKLMMIWFTNREGIAREKKLDGPADLPVRRIQARLFIARVKFSTSILKRIDIIYPVIGEFSLPELVTCRFQ